MDYEGFSELKMKCIYCEKEYYKQKIVDLGKIYPSLFLDSPAQTSFLKKEDLSLAQCPHCSFVQLTNVLEPDAMYRKYWYRSGLNNSMVDALQDVVLQTKKRAKMRYDRIMDIGCNDGTLLSFYDDKYFKVGYDPANNLVSSAIQNCDLFVNNYFDGSIEYKQPFDIITSIAMFYDIPEPRKFIKNICKYLAHNGIWVIQMTDLTCMLKVNAYDNICHEHLAYYSLKLLKKLLESEGLEIFDIAYNNVNGGSVRVYISREDTHVVKPSVSETLEAESRLLVDKDWKEFNRIIEAVNRVTSNFIKAEVANGKTVFGLGASTKGNTYLQCAGLTTKEIPYILEVSKDKFGKYVAGANIPIISEAEGMAMKPNYLLILPWHFTSFFVEKKLDYLKSGGIFIVAMPEPGIIYWSGDEVKFTSLDPTVKTWEK